MTTPTDLFDIHIYITHVRAGNIRKRVLYACVCARARVCMRVYAIIDVDNKFISNPEERGNSHRRRRRTRTYKCYIITIIMK